MTIEEKIKEQYTKKLTDEYKQFCEEIERIKKGKPWKCENCQKCPVNYVLPFVAEEEIGCTDEEQVIKALSSPVKE